MGELLSGGRSDGEAWRRTLPTRGLWGLDRPSKGARFAVPWSVVFRTRSLTAVLLAGLDDLPLSLSYIQASLELLTYGGVLGVKARR